jgi:hypothetical protein
MRHISIFFSSLALLAGLAFAIQSGQAAEGAADKAEAGFTSLFDGKTLAGWEGKADTFRVRAGAIVAGSLDAKVPQNEFLSSAKEYGDFELRLKAKLVGKGENAGVQFRSVRIPNHHEMIGFQCDMGLAGGKSIWGALYDESRRRTFLATGDATKLAKLVKADEFNDLVIRCQGPHIQIWVNGLQTVDYTEPDDKIARSGLIALQIHGGMPAEASYKDIRIKVLGGK